MFLSGPGVLGLRAVGGLPAVDAAASATRPPFAALRLSVERAGWATFQLKLSRATRRALARRHKLRLRVRLTFTPLDGCGWCGPSS